MNMSVELCCVPFIFRTLISARTQQIHKKAYSHIDCVLYESLRYHIVYLVFSFRCLFIIREIFSYQLLICFFNSRQSYTV